MADIITSPVDLTGVSVHVDTSGLFNPGAAFSINAATQVINAAWNKGLEKQTQFETKIGTASGSWLDPENAPSITAATAAVPSVTEPSVTIPATVNVADVVDLFDTKYLELVSLLSDKFTAFRTTYFPDESAAYSAAEDWLQAAFSNPNAGLPSAVVTQLVDDDKGRILADATRATDAVMQTFAARRFPLPPGAAAGAVIQIQQKAQEAIAESSRKITTMSVDQFRFVVQSTLGLRQSAMTAAIQYISALASGPDMASRVVGVGYDAQSKLISAASQFYNARTEAGRLVSDVNKFNATSQQDAAAKNQVANLTIIEDKLKALLSEAQMLAQMATSLFNNVHAGAGTNYSVSV